MENNPRIKEWKRRYGKVYKVVHNGDPYFFRAMNIGEFRRISLMDDMVEKEHVILTNGILWPTVRELDDLPSGLAERLVMYISNATNITEESMVRKVSEARDRLGITDNILSLQIELIKSLNYTPDVVDSMGFDEFVRAVVMAEAVLGRPLIAGSLDDSPQTQQQDDISSPGGPEPIVDVSNMKTIDEMEDVANRNADRLKRVWQKKKRLVRG